MAIRIKATTVDCWAFALALFLIVALRLLLIDAFPYGFGHPDTGDYGHPVTRFLQGGPFVPEPIRVMGTYAYFLIAVAMTMGATTFSVMLVQHVMGVVTAYLLGLLMRKLTGSARLGILTMLLVGLLPRGLMYEHIILAETTYLFLTILLALLALHFVRSSPRWIEPALGVIAGLMILGRGQGIIAVPLGLLILATPYYHRTLGLRFIQRMVRLFCLFFLPILALTLSYVYLNIRGNDFPGLSANAAYSLYTAGVSNLTDYESPKYAASKNILRECVALSNTRFDGRAEWALTEPLCGPAVGQVIAQFHGRWRFIEAELGGLAREAILTHPVAFLYRVAWNLRDFFWGRPGLLKTIDLRDLLFRDPVWMEQKVIEIDRQKTERIRDMGVPPLQGDHRFGLDRLASLYSASGSDASATAFSSILNWLSYLANCRTYLVGTLLLMALCWAHPLENRFFILWMLGLTLGQVVLTEVPVNALYDRYYVPIEPFQVIFWLLAIRGIARLSQADRRGFARLVLLLLMVATVTFQIAVRLPLAWFPNLDHPILNMAEAKVQMMTRYVFSWSAMLIAVVLSGAWYLHRPARQGAARRASA